MLHRRPVRHVGSGRPLPVTVGQWPLHHCELANVSNDFPARLRSQTGYALAREAIDILERVEAWPTSLNFELCLEFLADPQGDLAAEVRRLKLEGALKGEQKSEQLAAKFLPRLRLQDEISNAGVALTRELEQIGHAVGAAQASSRGFGQTLDTAGRILPSATPTQLADLVKALQSATRDAERQNSALSARLETSTAEVRQVREHLDAVRRQALTDGLTQLANRRAFDEALANRLAEADRLEVPLTLALFDIDRFKLVNDTFGHQTGDQVIRFVAQTLAKHAEPPRLAARYGGEEFAILFPHESAEKAWAAVEVIRTDISRRTLKRRANDEPIGRITVSVGLAIRERGEGAVSLLERADAALYTSKREGRDRSTKARPTGDKSPAPGS